MNILRALLLLTVLAQGSSAGDLGYPPPGVTIDYIPAGQGSVNRAQPIAGTPDPARRHSSHIVIDHRFRAQSSNAVPPPNPAVDPSPRQPARTVVIEATGTVTGEFDRGLLWRVEDDAGRVSHLFGTIHVEDTRVTQLPPQVTEAFDGSRAVVVEAVLDQLDLTRIGGRLVYLDGRSLRDVIDQPLFEQVQALLRRRGIPAPLATLMKPWAVALLLTQPAPRTGAVLDRQIQREARRLGKDVFALETIDEQLAVFDGLGEAEQATLLREAVRRVPQVPALIEQMIQAYLARDLAAMQELAEHHRLPSPLQATLQQKVVDDRNHTMLERMQPRLTAGRAFIAVGALHLPGDSGLLQQLKSRGYRLERVY